MFKKLKDKIAEEVKQSPSRIHQLAQAASSLTQVFNFINLLTYLFLSLVNNSSVNTKKWFFKRRHSLFSHIFYFLIFLTFTARC